MRLFYQEHAITTKVLVFTDEWKNCDIQQVVRTSRTTGFGKKLKLKFTIKGRIATRRKISAIEVMI